MLLFLVIWLRPTLISYMTLGVVHNNYCQHLPISTESTNLGGGGGG